MIKNLKKLIKSISLYISALDTEKNNNSVIIYEVIGFINFLRFLIINF